MTGTLNWDEFTGKDGEVVLAYKPDSNLKDAVNHAMRVLHNPRSGRESLSIQFNRRRITLSRTPGGVEGGHSREAMTHYLEVELSKPPQPTFWERLWGIRP